MGGNIRERGHARQPAHMRPQALSRVQTRDHRVGVYYVGLVWISGENTICVSAL